MSRSSHWAALVAGLAALIAMALPAVASAAVTPIVDDGTNSLVVTGDGADDTVALTVANGVFVVNTTPTTLAAGAGAHITVNTGDGNDTVDAKALAATDYATLAINGEAGNDNLTAGSGNDQLNGGAGNDTLVGFKGADEVNGDDDDDVMIWNPGDASDTNIGGLGNDEAVENLADVDDTFAISAEGATGVLFDRTAPVAAAFQVKLEAEKLTVNAKGGNDTGTGAALTAGRTLVTVNAGDGNDTITGSDGADTLNGGAGNDILVGGKANDTVNGEAGDDVMIWNPGDASDVNIGGEGNDEAVENLAPADDTFAISPEGAGKEVLFNRTIPAPAAFTVKLEAEKLTVNSLAGNDTGTAGAGLNGRTVVTINAGEGNDNINGGDGNDVLNGEAGADGLGGGGGSDTISGGAGNDVINGGEGADVISGGDENDTVIGSGGDDRLAGDKGADAVVGDTGDDTMVWNNGDASDTNDGGPGFDTAVENGAAGGDVLKLVPAGANATFERTNLVPFTVKLASQGPAVEANGGVELVAVNGEGGDDAFTVSAGTKGLMVIADGGAGKDTLTGAEESDSFFGSAGNDLLSLGAGSDLADGGEGDDTILARDAKGDVVHGGNGTDTAQTDALTVDSVDSIEKLDALPSPTADTKALLPSVGKIKVTGKGKKLTAHVPLSCPAAETGGCATAITLETAKAAHVGSVRAVLVLGSKSVKLAAGRRMTASVNLAAGVKDLAKHGKLAVRVRVSSSDLAGNTAIRTSAAGLKLPR